MQSKSVAKSTLQTLSLFTHGRNLMTPGAFGWVLFMGFFAFSMALIEGISWGRILSVFLPETLVWVAATLGLIWAVIIFGVDANFATTDTSGDYRRDAREQAMAKPPVSGWRAWFSDKRLIKPLTRVVIVSVSMALTGPFLAQTFDERKVVQAIEAENARRVATYRATVTKAADARVAEIDSTMAAANRRLESEVAGKGPSARHGCGATCKVITGAVEQLKGDRARAVGDKGQRLAALAAMTPTQLERDEGVGLLHDNADTRNGIRKQIEADSGETLFGLPASHVLASALFLLLFVAMLLLKLYQPRSVGIYYNEHLQEMFERYLAGAFAHLPTSILPASDRHDGPSPMGAQAFDAWYHEKYLVCCEARQDHETLQAIDERKASVTRRREETEAQIAQLTTDKAQLEVARQAELSKLSEYKERIMKQGDVIVATRHAKLTAQLDAIAEQDRQVGEERDALEVRAIQNANALEATSAAITQAERREGWVMGGNRHQNLHIVNPGPQAKLQGLWDDLEGLRGEKHAIDEERLVLTSSAERIAADRARIEAALAETGEPGPGDIAHLDPEIRALLEGLWQLRKERDELAPRIDHLEQQIARYQAGIDELVEQKLADVRLVAGFMREVRDIEARSSGTAFRHAA